jgi:hypothetical protein
MTTLDTLVFIPLIPALPVFATWFLPWEKRIPAKVPKIVIGPYLLYCAFGAWYFKWPWWGVTMILGFGVFVSAAAVIEWKEQKFGS